MLDGVAGHRWNNAPLKRPLSLAHFVSPLCRRNLQLFPPLLLSTCCNIVELNVIYVFSSFHKSWQSVDSDKCNK